MNLASKNQLYFYTAVIYLNVKKTIPTLGMVFDVFLLVCAPTIAHTRHHLRDARLQCTPYTYSNGAVVIGLLCCMYKSSWE